MTKPYRFETLQLHAGQETPDPATGARAVPIYQTTSYVFEDCDYGASLFDLSREGHIYSRISNPTTDVFEQRINALEGGVGALACATGAAAIAYTVQSLAHSGDHIVSAATIYGGTFNCFKHTLADFGITTTFVDPNDPQNFERAIQDNTKLLHIESLGNPNCNLIDIEAVAAIAHAHQIPLVVDSTFTTPYLLRPFEHGADIVVHSATKFLGGHGTTVGGVIVDGGTFDWAASGKFPQFTEKDESYHGVRFTDLSGKAAFITRTRCILMRDLGATLSPLHSFIFLQGLETLSLRIERHVQNALAVVDFLNKHPKIERVNHPSLASSGYKELYDRYFPRGAGSIFTVELKGGAAAAKAFSEKLRIFSLLANVADVKSLVIHPASTTHSQMTESELIACGVLPNSVRLSIGCENIDDLLEDLEQALA